MTRTVERTIFEIRSFDTISCQNSMIHRIDPRAKLITTAVFVVCVMSLGKYEISQTIQFFIYPAVMISLGGLPLVHLAKKMLIIAPFVLFIGIFNPFVDREPIINIAGVYISGGWVSFAGIMIRLALTVGAALILLASTGMNRICMALERLGTPKILAVQLAFIYRYLFVLTEETARMMRAGSLRNFRGRHFGLHVFSQMVGSLFLRTIDRSQRIHQAMVSRGFEGRIEVAGDSGIKAVDILFTIGWSCLFAAFRLYNLPRILGEFTLRSMG